MSRNTSKRQMTYTPEETVYVLKFSEPLGNTANPHGYAKHYTGYSPNVHSRIEAHRHGCGASITQAAYRNGIRIEVVALFEGGRDLERKIKNRKNIGKLLDMFRAGKQTAGIPAPYFLA